MSKSLGKHLVEELLKEGSSIKRIIAIYPGRFQPMGKHHVQAYKWLESKFGKENTIIVTSDKVEAKSPFNFIEKKKIANAMGVTNIQKVKNPYKAEEVLSKYDPETTAVVFMVGEKDRTRLKGNFFRPWKGEATVGYRDGAYTVLAPHVSLSVPGYGEMSGTAIRTALSSDIPADKKKKLFKDIMGFYNNSIYNMVINKLNAVNESIITEVSNTVPAQAPDVAYTAPGKKHKIRYGKWMDEWTQISFPEADNPFGIDTQYRTRRDVINNPELGNIRDEDGEIVDDYMEIVLEHMKKSLQEKTKKSSPEIEKALDTIVKYKDKEGADKEAKVKSILKNKDHEGYSKAYGILKAAKKKTGETTAGEPETKKITGETPKEPEVKSSAQQPKEKESAGKMTADDFKLDIEFTPDEQSDLPKDTKFEADKNLLDKIKNKINTISEEEKKFFRDGQHKPGSETRRSWADAIKSKSSGIIKGIKREIEHQKHSWKDAGSGLLKLSKGEKLNKNEIKGLKEVGKTIALTAVMSATGVAGVAAKAGAVGVAKYMAIHLAEHVATDIAILGVGKAALFASADAEIDKILSALVNKIADALEKGKIPPKVLDKAIDSAEKEQTRDIGSVDFTNESTFSKDWWKATLGEDITIPINVGDIVLGGKFKNKKIKVKEISKNEKGDITINGKPLMRYRLIPQGNVFEAKDIIKEGGAAGHMQHPFDDMNMTFGDIKTIIDKGLQGELNVEDNVTEKTDGQNLMVTWKDGELKAARNKGTLVNPLSISDIKSMFAGRGNIEKAFTLAMKDLSNAISKLSDKQKAMIFKDGTAFANLEIIYPATENVISYDVCTLMFHGINHYDNSGNKISSIKDGARILEGMIRQANAHIQDTFKIIKPQILTLGKHQDYSKKRDYFFSKLKKLQAEFNLKDSDTLARYHQKWWEGFISTQANKMGYNVSNDVLMGLCKRWAFNDKGFSINQLKQSVPNEKFVQWAIDFDKKDYAAQLKKNMFPFETLVFEAGAEILKNISGFLSANPDKTVQAIRNKVLQAIQIVKTGGDLKKLNVLNTQLEKIKSVGGFEKIVPTEGLVFVWNGKTYKITGVFGPVNQITGLMYF